MGSFNCPHKDIENERCYRLEEVCVPGRAGCVLEGSSFMVSAEERIEKKNSKRVKNSEDK